MDNINQRAIELHEKLQGKISTELKAPLENKDDLSLLYSPGVAEPCRKISENVEDVYKYTGKVNTIAVISNGTAVLGLGDIGPEAALPVMEGKCCLFKQFGGVNAIPLVINTKDVDEVVNFAKLVSPGLGGINLEDIKAPECIEIERRLKEELDIPVFHDDQHGTAIVTIAALINSLKLVGKKAEECNVVISGAGAAGSSIIRMLLDLGINNIYAFNSKGVINRNHKDEYTNELYKELSEITNNDGEDISLEDAMKKSDIFVGVSVPNKITKEMVKSMRRDPIIFAMANPNPEIPHEDAKQAGAKVVGT
ncbi:MAG: NAD(P)-dependent malic enzyme, partial [Anaerococcus sp.]